MATTDPPFDQSAYFEALALPRVWYAAQAVVAELMQRRSLLEDYIQTRGRTDWVFVEESIDLELGPDPTWEEHVAGVGLVIQALRLRWPSISPPTWFVRETWSTVGVPP